MGETVNHAASIAAGRSLRILFVRSYYEGRRDAVTDVIDQLGAGLTSRGHRISVLCEAGRGGQGSLLDVVSTRTHAGSRAVGQFIFASKAPVWLWLNRRRFDVVVTVDTPTGIGFVGRLLRLVTRGRLAHVHWVMDLFYTQVVALQERSRTSRSSHLRARLEVLALRGASPIVVLGSCVERVLRLARVETPVHVIHLTATATRRTTPTDFGAVRERMIVFYGGNASARNPLAAVGEAAMNARDVYFVVVGEGDEVDALRLECGRLQLTNVLIQGRLSDEEYRRVATSADVHLVSLDPAATGTSVPSKTYAAMAMGRPIIYMGEAWGQAARDVSAAGCGIVINVDSLELAAAVRSLQADPEARMRMSRMGRQFISKRRTPAAAIDAWEGLLHDATRR